MSKKSLEVLLASYQLDLRWELPQTDNSPEDSESFEDDDNDDCSLTVVSNIDDSLVWSHYCENTIPGRLDVLRIFMEEGEEFFMGSNEQNEDDF